MKNFWILILIIAVAKNGVYAELHYNDDVEVLTSETFKEKLNQEKAILVKFYAPWCGHCKSFSAKYSELASQLKTENDSPIIAVLDATLHKDVAEEQDIKHYPTIRLYKGEKMHEYSGKPDVTFLMKWLELKLNPAINVITSLEELNKLKNSHRSLFVSFIKDNQSESYSKLDEIAEKYEGEPMFVSILDDQLIKDLKLKDKTELMVYKKFDELEAILVEDASPEHIQHFVDIHKVPLLSNFGADDSKLLFEIKVNVLLFAGKNHSIEDAEVKLEQYRDSLRKAAKGFRGTVAFAHIDTDVEDHSRIMEYFDLSHEDLPAIRLIKLGEDLIKYTFNDKEINEKTVTDFVQQYLDGKLKPHYKSQEVPANWDSGPVVILVQSNFDSIVKDEYKAVLVEFYATWCGICQRLEPVYNELGTYFKDNKDVVIAKIDATANEIDGIPIRSYPTIILFPRGNGNHVIYDSNRTIESFIQFIEHDGIIPDVKPQDKVQDKRVPKEEL